jgi:hypothetical protein
MSTFMVFAALLMVCVLLAAMRGSVLQWPISIAWTLLFLGCIRVELQAIPTQFNSQYAVLREYLLGTPPGGPASGWLHTTDTVVLNTSPQAEAALEADMEVIYEGFSGAYWTVLVRAFVIPIVVILSVFVVAS